MAERLLMWRGGGLATRLGAALAIAAALAGCAGLPDRVQPPPSSGLPASAGSPLFQIAATSIEASAAGPGESAFRLMHSGTHALDARIALVRAARRSLDVQYYHVADDNTGRGFLRELRDAAARGVRVRLLIDDLYTTGEQEPLSGLAAFAGIEVRLFNPFPLRDGSLTERFAASLFSFGRLEMRMHNKLLVADGAFAVAGGRNIADEYYWQSSTGAFFDLDVLAAGPIVADLSTLFDRYWNSERVWPVRDLARSDPAAASRASFEAWVADAKLPDAPRIPVDLLGYERVADELKRGRVRLQHGRVRAVADSPLKLGAAAETQVAPDGVDIWSAPSEIRRVYNGVLRGAQREVTLISPYAVPDDAGLARLRANRDRGIAVRILTNSLASTDEPVVHTGYRRYRKAMIATGTELYEVDPQPSSRLFVAEMRGRPTLRIHTKSAIVDRRIVYIGSMNLDPRSAALNTEIGLVIESEPFAADVLTMVERVMKDGAWRVELGVDGDLEWSSGEPGAEVLRVEPRTTPLQRAWIEVLSWFVPEGSL